MSTKTKTQASKAAAELADTLESAPDTGAPDATRVVDYTGNYAAQSVRLPATVQARLRRSSKTVEGFGTKERTPRAPVLSIVRSDDKASNGMLLESVLRVPFGHETFVDGLTGKFDRANGECVGGTLKLEPADGREFHCIVPTTSGPKHAYTIRAKVIEFEVTPAADADIKPETLNALLCDRKVTNVHAALASLMGVEYKRRER